MDTDTLKHVREAIKVLRRHDCSDAQILAILLDGGADEPTPTKVDRDDG